MYRVAVSEEAEVEEGEEKKLAAVRRREVKLETISEGERTGRREEERRKRERKKSEVRKIWCFVMRKRFFRSAIETFPLFLFCFSSVSEEKVI